jgi:AcrR family transcriptional regulator
MVELTRQFRVFNMSYMRSEARARQILDCAKRVFAERGFHAANISHICEAAGIGRGTLYQYFKSKHSVLTAILRETLQRVRTLMERQAETNAYPPPETISRSLAIKASAMQLREVLAVVFDDSDTLRLLLREAVGLDANVEALLAEIDEVFIGLVERDIRRAMAAGYTRELDPRAVATMVVGGVEKLALHALRGDSPVDLDALAREATTLHTIGTLSDRLKPG